MRPPPRRGISCWGSNWFGQLGDATGADSALPVEVRGIPKAVAVSAGAHRSCAVLEEGTVSCWGPAGRRPLGKVEEPTPPVAVTGVENAVAVAAGEDWDCAVVASGSVWCWNDPEAEPGDTGKEVISGVSNATAVSVNGAGACALREGGTVVCWGLADGLESDPVAVQGISGATAISSTLTYPEQTCALLRDATVECWATAQEPRAVEGISAATAISGLCAVVDDGSVSCWSRPDGADPEAELSPVVVRGVADATSVSSNRWGGSCAVHGGGQVTCWGKRPEPRLRQRRTARRARRTPPPRRLPATPDNRRGGRLRLGDHPRWALRVRRHRRRFRRVLVPRVGRTRAAGGCGRNRHGHVGVGLRERLGVRRTRGQDRCVLARHHELPRGRCNRARRRRGAVSGPKRRRCREHRRGQRG
ncbi:MAG: hypothetical protein M5U19_16345 [Microthrixaceae bacterium]|nr:hypothetical protein [Microthrixaceae bacterium]